MLYENMRHGVSYAKEIAEALAAKNEPASAIADADYRSAKRREHVSEAYALLTEKLGRLHKQWAIETDPERKFQLEKQIEAAKNDRKSCE